MDVATPGTTASATDGQRALESFGYKQELHRSVATVDLVVYGLVFMVPIAPWAIFGTVYNSASGMVPLVYLIGLMAMVFTALAYAQMAKSFPLAGSVFSYVGRGIHPGVGFFAGWGILLDYLLIPTLLYVFAAESMIGLFPDTPRWLWAIVFVVVNTVINLLGVDSLKRGQPGLPGHRADLRGALRDHRGAGHQR
jgi:amino acid transporter